MLDKTNDHRFTAEHERLKQADNGVPWRMWGPYLSERQWGTVREDYSSGGNAWESFPHDQARSRAYRWGEDGLMGISDERSRLCFSLALWNERDPILKERLFGLTSNEGNHGEDVKEYYFYLENTPSHSYMKGLYKYPQQEFPYNDLVAENRRRWKEDPEYELLDTGIFDHNAYFDVFVEYAKDGPDDIVIKITAHNRGQETAPLHLLPTLWFRNTWSWGYNQPKPLLKQGKGRKGFSCVEAAHPELGTYRLACQGAPELLFTDNDSNMQRLWGGENSSPYVKDSINDTVVHGAGGVCNPDATGTKAAAHYRFDIEPGGSVSVMLRLSANQASDPFKGAADVLSARQTEMIEFYDSLAPDDTSDDRREIQRQAYAGLLWSKQFFYYDLDTWLKGDPAGPPPPHEHLTGRNAGWKHLRSADVILMPDKWEYPWFAAWDLAFHCLTVARIDPALAKDQLLLLLHQRYIHPNGQLPAYEWAFSDVNPPVTAWAILRTYELERDITGRADPTFLEKAFHKLLLNFTWWVNRKDSEGLNIFEGGFLGLDNISVFDRSAPLPSGEHLEQADATAWMGFYCLNMMTIALEISRNDPIYEDIATKFFEHFMHIAKATHAMGDDGISLWDAEDGFFYDALRKPDDSIQRLKVRSLVGLMPLIAVEDLTPELLSSFPFFKAYVDSYLADRPDMAALIPHWHETGEDEVRLLTLVSPGRLKDLLKRMLDPEEFLGDYGVRSVSRLHRDSPYVLEADGIVHDVTYAPAESTSGLFGGNSNWRGPVWMPINYLLVEALRIFDKYHPDEFVVEHPIGSGNMQPLQNVAYDLAERLVKTFERDEVTGLRPVYGNSAKFQHDPHWRDYVLFYEYFHGDTGQGLGASHQTGWTALIARMIDELAVAVPVVQVDELLAA